MPEPRPTRIALLRGINVGGKNPVPMSELKLLFGNAGAEHVRTYIQSGNVVFKATTATALKASAAIRERWAVPVILRTLPEFEEAIAANPFLLEGGAPGNLHVYFMQDSPDLAQISNLDPDRSPPDTFIVRGREVYINAPNGMGRTRLTNAWFDSKLRTVSTARNWRTSLKLLEMARETI